MVRQRDILSGVLLPEALKVSTIAEISLDDLEKVNRLLQEEIIYKFITTKPGIELSYKNLRNIFELLISENKHWEYTLSAEIGNWSIPGMNFHFRINLKAKTSSKSK